ncbi:uncharacterized protein LOC105841465 [Bombyx mori]|uniref:Uncharacterized protein n=1 Tax=Bombyx mori TaxID=7091 RepID=A0A8R2C5D8_BOMMO|nr:uncharacterized protein LOC105841465 [Bombyx mori]
MMDIKEIIKWFIPCFHILRNSSKMDARFVCVVCLVILNSASCANVRSEITKNVGISFNYNGSNIQNMQNGYLPAVSANNMERDGVLENTVGRTFGRPFKKMAQAMIPLAFQVGAASTWAVIAAIVGVKTLAVVLLILKLLLLAGAAKLGALFGAKGQYSVAWETPYPHAHQKEIHLHIHNGHHELHGDSALTSWNRDGAAGVQDVNTNVLMDPYAAGPQTISTPYGNYVKVEPAANNGLTNIF